MSTAYIGAAIGRNSRSLGFLHQRIGSAALRRGNANAIKLAMARPMSTRSGLNVEGAMDALRKANAVCFDVDSTVIREEGIDVLADSLGKGEEVAAWTAQAMGGSVKFEDALAARLNIMKPSKQQVELCLENHPLQLSPGMDDLVKALAARGTDVYLVSGGFRIMIEPVAHALDIPLSRLFANSILFDTDGSYKGFDDKEFTSRDGGKPRALEHIKAEGKYDTMVMVGDGMTDAQAKPPADAFIGYGGAVVREAVAAKACWYVKDFDEMIRVVKES